MLGLLLLLGFIFYPVLKLEAFKEPLVVAFLLTALISFITEDTLETQAGATFFAFFYGILVFARPRAKARSAAH